MLNSKSDISDQFGNFIGYINLENKLKFSIYLRAKINIPRNIIALLDICSEK